MKKALLLSSLILVAPFAFANEQGFFVGGGAATTSTDGCGSECDSDGIVVEGGYYFNNIVGVEAKYSRTEFDHDSEVKGDIFYAGANVGHTFNSSWIRLYGKAGYSYTKEKGYGDSYSDSNFAYGLGVSVTPFAHQSHVYFKVEAITMEFEDSDFDFLQLSVGYQF